jgi:microcystin-dependent protein
VPITFGGIDVTPAPFAADAVERWWHLHRIRESAVPGGRATTTYHLPTGPEAENECPRPGVLHWPTGAARWATCHLLVTGDELAELRALGATADLVLSDGRQTVTAAGMRQLPARPVSQRGDGRELYLVTLVDERWDWWSAGAAIAPTAPASWNSLLASLFSLVGVTATIGTIPAAYSQPTPERWALDAVPVPLILDAAARQCGLKIVRTLAGAVECQTYTDAAAADASRWTTHRYEVMAGGRLAVADIGRSVPASVDVYFRGGAGLTENRALADLTTDFGTATGYADRVGYIHAEPPAYTQESEREAYADQAATDWYNWQLSLTDATFRGFRVLEPCGLDDAVEWVLTGTETATRVLRPPFGDCNIYGDWSRDQSGDPPYPTCAGSGSGSVDPVVWYTRYLHLGGVSVSVGDTLRPRQRLGYLGLDVTGGPHLHFAVCDGGDPFLWPGTDFPVAGIAVDVYDLLGVPLQGVHVGDPPPRAERFTTDQRSFVESRLTFPLDGDGWACGIGSAFHTLYDYYACDLVRLPFEDTSEAGSPVYSAVVGDDVLTEVVYVSNRGSGGWAVLLKHSRCGLPDDGDEGANVGNPIYPGDDPTYDGDTYPYSPGDPHNPQGNYLPLVSRVCIGPLTAGTLVGRLTEDGDGPMQEVCIGDGLELVDGTLNATGGGGAAPAGTGFARVTSGVWDTPAELSGDVTTSGGFSTTLSATGVSAGTYTSVTVDTKGRVTGGTNPTLATVPSGTLIDFAGTSAPTGYLACDGSAVSRTTYSALFAVISTTWGAGDGSTTFNLPDFRRRASVGSGGSGTGTLGNAVGNTGGAETHTLSTTEMPSHTHNVAGKFRTATVTANSGRFEQGDASVGNSDVTSGSAGSGSSHNNIQPSAVVLKCIKT